GQKCTQTAPCGLIGTALGLAMPDTWIHIETGTYTESLILANASVHLVGKDVLVVPNAGAAGAVVSGSSAVTIRGLDFNDAGPGGSADGITCTGTSPTKTKLHLTGVSLKGNAGVGLRASQCAIVVEQALVMANSHQGLLVSDSTFDVHDSVIAGNSEGVIFTNPVAGGANRFDFNTVANNINSGVACNGPSATLTFDSNIVYANSAGAQVTGSICAWTYSDIGPMGVVGDHNINDDPMFIDSSFHIASTSPCVNAGDPNAPPGLDI